MADSAIVAEGVTEQVVIKNVLLGFFEHAEAEPEVTFVQPANDETRAHAPRAPGGWTLVMQYCKQARLLEALQFSRFVVVHIDTDVAADFGVPLIEAGRQLTLDEQLERVVARVREWIGDATMERYGARVLFAIGVDSVECWLLPLLVDRSQKQRRAKTTGCLAAANEALRKADRETLSSGDSKDPGIYRRVSDPYSQRRTLDQHGPVNPGLRRFLGQLAAIPFGGDVAGTGDSGPEEGGSADGDEPETKGSLRAGALARALPPPAARRPAISRPRASASSPSSSSPPSSPRRSSPRAPAPCP